ncbi:hypothetical protein QR680_009009 [Steinernema hermaphroditum]|uniref:28S ribosomal protein S22, mitochondrial n=1 Tax=Steinernema hermaphroditum TaxID=289476 RepID=A0AA39M939_9BILA|nr:hypothetical protein QR680_009009 [Steinernema hermaphroditum]
MISVHRMLKSTQLLRSSLLFSLRPSSSSAWLKPTSKDVQLSRDNADVESLFINPDIQSLLKQLTGMDLESKVFAERKIGRQERSHYALMTDKIMRNDAVHFLQFVPLKEPRGEGSFEVLSVDSEIAKFDESRFVFTDITFDATDQDRTVVVRESDGTLRTATPEEHDRMNRIYYEQPHRPVVPPSVFSDPALGNALNLNRHEFVMDWACWFYQPDDPEFVKLSREVFDRTMKAGKFDVLYSTRHFGSLVFYVVLNGDLPPLLNFYARRGKLPEAANLIRLQKLIHPNWRTAISSEDDDLKIVKDFVAQNKRLKEELHDLIKLSEGRYEKSVPSEYSYTTDMGRDLFKKSHISMDAETIQTESGPLGEMASSYKVRIARDESGEKNASRKGGRRRGRRTQDKPSDGDVDGVK